MFLISLTIAPLTIFCRDELEEVCEEVEEEECALQDEQVCQQVSGGGRGGEGLGGWGGGWVKRTRIEFGNLTRFRSMCIRKITRRMGMFPTHKSLVSYFKTCIVDTALPQTKSPV